MGKRNRLSDDPDVARAAQELIDMMAGMEADPSNGRQCVECQHVVPIEVTALKGILVILVVSVWGCSLRGTEDFESSDPDSVPRSVVLSEDAVSASWFGFAACTRRNTDEFRLGWAPDAAYVEEVDAQLVRPSLAAGLAGISRDPTEAQRYVVQYFGVYRENRPLLFANGLLKI